MCINPKSIIAAVCLLGLASNANGQISGRVFEDKNKNGTLDAGEYAYPNIKVSDGVQIVKTDANGRWRIEQSTAKILFLIKPSHLSVPLKSDGLPAFWTGLSANRTVYDFPVHRAPNPKGPPPVFDLLVFGDPQPKNKNDVDYYARDIVAPLIGKANVDLGISLGDIVHGNLSLYPAMNVETAKLKTPWLHVSGNHDRDYEAQTDELSLQTFQSYYGPDTFAWEHEGVAVIVLDNVLHQPIRSAPAKYSGGLRADQFTFLENYLADLPDSARLIVAMHMPLFDSNPDPAMDSFRAEDRKKLYALLQRFNNVQLLTSHMHTQSHVFHDKAMGWNGVKPLHEYNVGATCGAFWSGRKDEQGIPDTMMQDGTPNGYARLSWKYSQPPQLTWFNARDKNNAQIKLYAPKVLRKEAYPGYAVYANVFMGMPQTRVEYRVGDGPWKSMQKVERADPRVLERNMDEARSTTLVAYDLTPEASSSTHLWRGVLPTDLKQGVHRIEARALINEKWVSASSEYQLQSAQP